jgi:hypothetical protein
LIDCGNPRQGVKAARKTRKKTLQRISREKYLTHDEAAVLMQVAEELHPLLVVTPETAKLYRWSRSSSSAAPEKARRMG